MLFGYSGSLIFLCDFKISLLNSATTKNFVWDFDMNCVQSIYQFGENAILVALNLLGHEHVTPFHSFRSPFTDFHGIL